VTLFNACTLYIEYLCVNPRASLLHLTVAVLFSLACQVWLSL
jgi:hypothetical protein